MSAIMITGSRSGLGAALAKVLVEQGHYVLHFDSRDSYDVRKPPIFRTDRQLDVLINCAGVNRINWLEDVKDEEWDLVMDTNAKGIFKMTQACLPHLIKSKGTVVNIVSNAAHMPMRCSLAYNASKAAALMMTKQLARELTPKYGITVFSVSPNKLSGTGMSKDIDEQVMKTRSWSKEEAQKYQLAGLLTGEETPASVLADFIAYLLTSKQHHKYLSGCDLQYGL